MVDALSQTLNPETLKKTGTTTVGLTAKDGAVIGTEHRATMGTLIAHKDTQKLFRIGNHMALTTAGLVGDAQILARYLDAEAKLYEMKREQPIPIKSAATLMANILNSRKFYPYYVQLIVGGWDREGAHVFSLDAAGGSIPDKWTTTGSGSPYVFGVLEDHYKDDITATEALDLAIRGLNAATRRDSASGNGMDLAVIGPRGYQSVAREEIDRRLKKLGLPPIPA
ncbi:MAG: archaeal proteasome endopeptidase complex subunit beta [Euryarchaeota archaeon]|nr:archaeal proteasome endopeptidase complex subunit beta [Euryarchaeota archaeon]